MERISEQGTCYKKDLDEWIALTNWDRWCLPSWCTIKFCKGLKRWKFLDPLSIYMSRTCLHKHHWKCTLKST